MDIFVSLSVAQVAANTNSANSSSSSYRYEFPLLCTSSSRAMTDNLSVSAAGETSFSQLIHWHPSVHLEFFLLHPQTLFLHPVTHLHSLNSKFTNSHTNCMFSSVSHTTQSFVFSIVQPFSVMGLNPWYFCLPVPTCLEPSMFSSSGNRVHQWMESCLCQM